MRRAEASGIRLTDEDAAIAKGMIDRGDRQHDIAAWFGVNGGRIAEISTGDTFPTVAAATANLPPPGPYVSGRGVSEAKRKLAEIRGRLSGLIDEIDEQIDLLGN